MAVQDAERAVAAGKPFLYSSGGFVCRPVYDAKYRSLAQGLPTKTLACGCVLNGLSLVQAAYARVFNERVLHLLEANRVH